MSQVPKTTRQYYFPKRSSYGDLILQEVALSAPKADEVLVKTQAVSLQFRDLLIARDAYPGSIPSNLIPCSDMAGEIIAVGGDVKQWKIGDRVSANFMLDKIHEHSVAISKTALGGPIHGVLTEYRTFLHACAALTAYDSDALTGGHAPIKAGDTILVLGTGGVSTFALQFAVASGATVIALSSSDEKLKVVKKLGAKHTINYKMTPNWDEEVLRLTNGTGVDRVIEVVGNATLQRSIGSLKFGGSIQLIGRLGGMTDVPPADIIIPSIQKGVNIRGVFVGSLKQFKDLNKLIEANIPVTRPVIDKVFAFEDAKAAYAYFESQAHVGKVVIKF
ncbi:alcohol dehydrogenase superfamily protein [Mycena galericulata]|nr:alcohol dehydrogenase superfamily protein [Mycena galericulata]